MLNIISLIFKDIVFAHTFGNSGVANQLLATTGASSVQWVNADTTSVGSATSITVTQENTVNATRHLTFVADTSGTDNIRIDTGLTYNPNSNTLTAGTFSGNLSGTLSNTLTLNTSGPGLSGSTTFNNSGDATFTVTSNATTFTSAGTLVIRDGGGGFRAGIITATSFDGSGASLSSLSATSLTGTIDVNRLGSSGTRDSTTFLRGDNTWAVVDTSVTVNQSSYGGTNPITTSGNTITIGTASNAYGRRTVQTTVPTSGGNDGDIVYVI